MAPKKGKKSKETKKEKKTEKPEKSEKLVVREPPLWHPMDIMRSFDEEFDEFRRSIERSLGWSNPWRRSTLMTWPEFYWPKLELPDTKQPLMDIKDTGKELIIEAEMPGIPKENIDIQLTGNSIQICGTLQSEEKNEDEGYYRQERSYTKCFRQVPLPAEVMPDKADATLEDGILHIKIQKKKSTSKEKAHKVNVK